MSLLQGALIELTYMVGDYHTHLFKQTWQGMRAIERISIVAMSWL